MASENDSEIALNIEDRDQYLLVEARGPYSMAGSMALFHAAIEAAAKRPHRGLLIDVRGIVGQVSTTDRFEFGGRMAQSLVNLNLRLALFSRADQMTPEGFLQSVMVNRGARVRVDSDLPRLQEWLLQDVPPT